MNIAILGTGMVGTTLAAGLARAGHAVVIGTRDVAATLARTEKDPWGNEPFAAWHAQYPAVRLASFADAAADGELVINATSGRASLEALAAAGSGSLAGKILIDVANPLDFSNGFPPSLLVSNTDSLGEQIQRAFPDAKVVKTLNTVSAPVMINPGAVAGGDHTLFVCGNDAAAKETVTGYLRDWFGWKDVRDLGDITAARGTEMYLALWVRMWGITGTPLFSIKLVQ